MKRKFILFELQSSTDLKTSPIPRNVQRKKQKCSSTTFLQTRKKIPFFLSTNTERQILVRNNFQGANYVNLHDGSKTLKFEDIVRLKVILHETICNNDLYRNKALQHCWDIVSTGHNIGPTLQCCVALKNRRCESSRVKSPWGSGSLKCSS